MTYLNRDFFYNSKIVLENIRIDAPNEEIFKQAKQKWDKIAKPLDSMGDFETMVSRMCAMTENIDYTASQKVIVVACADNGIVEEGVTQCGKEVTAQVAKGLGLGTSSLCVLAKKTGADIYPVDIAIDSDEIFEGVINKKIAKGSKNFMNEPAMSLEETELAINEGINFAYEIKAEGYDLIAGGEMGIGNTTTSTAVMCSLLNLDSSLITGRGAGLSDNGLLKKQEVIKKGMEKYGLLAPLRETEVSDIRERTLKTLSCVGGFDIAFLAGLYIGAAINKIPVVLDGFISVTAALAADNIAPGTKDYLIASHKGRSKGIEIALSHLGLTPFINGDMALGEGTGAAMMMPLIDMALDFYNNGTSFEAEEIESYTRF